MATDRGSESGDLRTRMETLFEAWGHRAFERRWLLLLASLLASALLISQLGKLSVDYSADAFLHPDDPIRVVYDDFRRRVGRDELIALAIETDRVFDLDFLSRPRALARDLEERVPHLDDITSLTNARLTRGEGYALVVQELLEDPLRVSTSPTTS